MLRSSFPASLRQTWMPRPSPCTQTRRRHAQVRVLGAPKQGWSLSVGCYDGEVLASLPSLPRPELTFCKCIISQGLQRNRTNWVMCVCVGREKGNEKQNDREIYHKNWLIQLWRLASPICRMDLPAGDAGRANIPVQRPSHRKGQHCRSSPKAVC